jgi:hypothetical protein
MVKVNVKRYRASGPSGGTTHGTGRNGGSPLESSVAPRTFWPDQPNGNAFVSRISNNVRRSSIRPRRLAVPDRPQFAGQPDHELARRHVSLRGGLGEGKPVHGHGPRQKHVVLRECLGWQTYPVFQRRNDRLDLPARIQHRAGEYLISPISKARQPRHGRRLLTQRYPDRLTDQARSACWQATVPRHSYAR